MNADNPNLIMRNDNFIKNSSHSFNIGVLCGMNEGTIENNEAQ